MMSKHVATTPAADATVNTDLCSRHDGSPAPAQTCMGCKQPRVVMLQDKSEEYRRQRPAQQRAANTSEQCGQKNEDENGKG